MRRKEALYAVIGGVVGAVLVMAAGWLSPLGAQNEARDAEFDTITCRKIWGVDSNGATWILLVAHEDGGYVSVEGKDGELRATLE